MSDQMQQHNVHCQMPQHNVYSTEIADVLPIFGAPAAGVSPQFVPVTRWTDAAAVISNQIEIHAAAGKRAIDHSLGTAGCNVSHANKRSCPGDVISHTAAVWHHPPCPPQRIAPVCHAEDIRECGYIGVRWSRKKLRWRVRINAEGKDNHVGFFADPVAAAMAYDKAAKRFSPDWANDPYLKLNFVSNIEAVGGAGLSVGSVCVGGGGRAASLSARAPRSNSASNVSMFDSLLALNRSPQNDMMAHVRAAASASGSGRRSNSPGTPGSSMSPLQFSMGGVMLSGTSVSPCQIPTPGSTKLAPLLPHAHVAAANLHGAESTRAGKGGGGQTRGGNVAGQIPGNIHEKASLSHLLDDKSSLRTPSPADIAAGEFAASSSVLTLGSLSSMSTPASLQSPSFVWSSPVQPHQDTSNVDTPPQMVQGPPRLSSAAQKSGVMCHAPSVMCHGSQRQALGGSSAAHTQHVSSAGVRGDLPAEQEVLRTLVALRNSGPATGGGGRASLTPTGSHSHDEALDKPNNSGDDSVGWMSMSLSLVTTAATETKQQQQQMSLCESKHQRLWDSHRGSFVYGVPTQGLPPPKKEKEKPLARKKNQSYRGVTWDKVKQMWRVRLCLAGGGREHVGYFADEEEGAWAYRAALERLNRDSQAGPTMTADSPVSQQEPPPTSEAARRACSSARSSSAAAAWSARSPNSAPCDTSAAWGRSPISHHTGLGIADSSGTVSHVLATLPGSPSTSVLFHAHVNPSQVLNFQAQQALHLGIGTASSGMPSQASLGMAQQLGTTVYNELLPVPTVGCAANAHENTVDSSSGLFLGALPANFLRPPG